jgi:hypothetical protein
MSRLSAGQLIELAEALPSREHAITEAVAQLRLVSAKQLQRLCFTEEPVEPSLARTARRVLAGLVAERVLMRLERRVGGIRAGSAGHIYGLGPIGKRLIAYWRGEGLGSVRTPYEPGAAFVRHTLAISEHYVRLVEAEREGRFELLGFDAEPECWRPFLGIGGRQLVVKPDAFVRLGVDEFEQRSFLEVDCGTHGRGALVRKCQRYLAYFRSGREQASSGVFPRVVWSTTNQTRVALLVDVCSSLAPESWQIFAIGTPDRAVALLSGDADDPPVARRQTP